jgi:hypothetical protein
LSFGLYHRAEGARQGKARGTARPLLLLVLENSSTSAAICADSESKIKVVVRSRLLSSLKCPEGDGHSAPELVATMVSWAIYGAALAWCRSKAQRAEEFAMTVLPLMTAILQLPMGLEERET